MKDKALHGYWTYNTRFPVKETNVGADLNGDGIIKAWSTSD